MDDKAVDSHVELNRTGYKRMVLQPSGGTDPANNSPQGAPGRVR